MEEESKEEPLFKGREVIVIHYVQPSMSNELLGKFPDNSAFDFDYSQSSIWSPVVPRFHCLNTKSPELKRRLSFDNDCHAFGKFPVSAIKKKVCSFGLKLNAKLLKKKKSLKYSNDCEGSSDFHPTSPPIRKGLGKALKMASKKFKKKRDHQKHQYHPISHVTLADYLQCRNI